MLVVRIGIRPDPREAMERLTHLEQDALEELLRMQVQRASLMLDDLTPANLTVRFQRYGSSDRGETHPPAWLVKQKVSGEIDGEAGWWIPCDDARGLVRRVRRAPVGWHDITPLEREALIEIGHILIDGVLDGLMTSLGLRLCASVPTLCPVAGDPELAGGARAGVQLAHVADGVACESRLMFAWSEATASKFQRALALYVSPFLSELSDANG